MPNPMGSMRPRAIFMTKMRGMNQAYGRHRKTLQNCLLDVFEAEETGKGTFSEKTYLKLENMAANSLANLKIIQAVMHDEPNLRLPRKVLSRFVFVIVNARLLLARIERFERFEEDTEQVRVGSSEIAEFDTDSNWDPDPLNFIGKKI